MGKYSGKSILFLGSSAGSVDLIHYAKTHGAHIVVTDNLPISQSPAKAIADEALPHSTADLDILCEEVTKRGISCVFSGISEFNIVKAIEISERCCLPFYCTKSLWDQIESKSGFRSLCLKHNVPTPQTYYIGRKPNSVALDSIYLPAVVKPVDSSSSIGVHICHSKTALEAGCEDALRKSPSGTIIIEEYVQGSEFTAHYTVTNGKATLSCVDNRYPTAVHEGNVTTVPAARVYPSLFIDEYISSVNSSMVSLCEDLGMKYGVLFIQGMYNSTNDAFYIFEAGLRSAAECPFLYTDSIIGINYYHMILDEMLGVPSNDSNWPDDPYLDGKACGVISYVARPGTVSSTPGLDTVQQFVQSIIKTELRYPIGTTTPDGDTLHQLLLRFYLICNDRESMIEDIAKINGLVDVKDEFGNSLAIKFDPERLRTIP